MNRSPFAQAPEMTPLPSPKWMHTVYIKDVQQHLDVKAKLTSTFGDVIKMDSTMKVRFHSLLFWGWWGWGDELCYSIN